MPTTVIERELSEQTFATLWKYVKCILRMHIAGIANETKADHDAQAPEGANRTS